MEFNLFAKKFNLDLCCHFNVNHSAVLKIFWDLFPLFLYLAFYIFLPIFKFLYLQDFYNNLLRFQLICIKGFSDSNISVYTRLIILYCLLISFYH